MDWVSRRTATGTLAGHGFLAEDLDDLRKPFGGGLEGLGEGHFILSDPGLPGPVRMVGVGKAEPASVTDKIAVDRSVLKAASTRTTSR